MTMKRVVLEIGMGTDIRGADYTKAAVRALRDALWHNSFSAAAALDLNVDDMEVEVKIGVPKPDQGLRDLAPQRPPKNNLWASSGGPEQVRLPE